MTVYVVTWYDGLAENEGIAAIFHTREDAKACIAKHNTHGDIILNNFVEEFEVQ